MKGFELINVWKKYGKTVALAGISASFRKGLNVVVGPNGSGKTTMIKVMLGLAKPDSGKVLSLGRDPFKHRDEIFRRIGVAIEGMSLPWWTSGLDLVKTVSTARALEWSIIRELADELGVSTYWHRSIRGYSMGMRKRLVLLLGFAAVGEALVMDEPFTQLDSASRKTVDELILKFSREVPVVVSTHVLARSVFYADTVIVLFTGRVVKVADKDAVGRRDFVCERRGRAEQLVSKLARAGPIKHLELGPYEVFVSYEKDVSNMEFLEGLGCNPSLFRLLKYEELLGGENGAEG